jgi:hypothetical protein
VSTFKQSFYLVGLCSEVLSIARPHYSRKNVGVSETAATHIFPPFVFLAHTLDEGVSICQKSFVGQRQIVKLGIICFENMFTRNIVSKL